MKYILSDRNGFDLSWLDLSLCVCVCMFDQIQQYDIKSYNSVLKIAHQCHNQSVCVYVCVWCVWAK